MFPDALLRFEIAMYLIWGFFCYKTGVPVLLCGVAFALLGSACHAPTVMLANIIATPAELA